MSDARRKAITEDEINNPPTGLDAGFRLPVSALAVLAVSFAVPAQTMVAKIDSGALELSLAAWALAFAVAAFVATLTLIPNVQQLLLRAGLYGVDLSKVDKVKVPESMGLVPGVIYLMAVIVFQVIEPTRLVGYNAALTSLTFMLFLGFADDVLNLRWRYKLILPSVATVPLLVAYQGSTSVLVPRPLHELLGPLLDLGILYKVYMGMLGVFCSNAVNIYAGINGLEVGQSIIIACFVLHFNLEHLDNTAFSEGHFLSVLMLMPFIAVCTALLYYNWYPSRVFVGDTFTTFAGMVFAVVGILGHFSETLLLFFLPQFVNFAYSIPQLIGIIPCPRHRVPRFDPKTGKMHAIPSNLTLINLVLMITGPLYESTLCVLLLVLQIACCALGLWLRVALLPLFRE